MLLQLVWTKAKFNLRADARKNHLSYLWWILEPLLYMVVFYVVFGLLLKRGGEGFVAYLLTGLVPFQWFAKSVQGTSSSIIGGKGLMHKVRITPLFFPFVGLTQSASKQSLVFLMLFIFLFFYGIPPVTEWLGFIPVMLTQFVLIATVSCAVAMVMPFLRDLQQIIPTAISFTMFASGIFYTIERIPEEWRPIYFLNPMATLLYEYRRVLIEGHWPDMQALGWIVLVCVLVIAVLALSYRKLEQLYPRIVIE
jgi:lipopolysaccharide transport system permease protein